MQYDYDYHLICKIELDSGREVRLREIHQQQTYWGMMGGHPSDTSNDWIIKNAVEDAAQNNCVGGGEPVLLPPQRRNFFREPGDMQAVIDSRTRKVEWLPLIRCVGIFSSSRPARDPSKDTSYLTVLWYQNRFAMPIAPEILSQLKSINWNEHATDIDNN